MRQLDGGTILLSPTDLTSRLACEYLAGLRLRTALGEIRLPRTHDPHAEALAARGAEHEERVLDRLEREVGTATRIEFPHPYTVESLRSAEKATHEAMRAGAPLIYQATFFDGRWVGHADFLRRISLPSALGDWSYEVHDGKLSRGVKPSAVHQLCSYALHLDRLQERAPVFGHLLLGDGSDAVIQLESVMAIHRHARRSLEELVDSRLVVADPEPVSHCAICDYVGHCYGIWRAKDHLRLVANIRRDQRDKLTDAGISTLTELAVVDPDRRISNLAPQQFELLSGQAGLQLESRETGRPSHRHLPPERARGYALLTSPSQGDVFFDLEGDPYVGEKGIEYLWGYEIWDDAKSEWTYRAIWAHDEAEERRAFEQFVDMVVERRERYPDLHVFHYAPHEATKLHPIKGLAGHYGTRETEVDDLLREQVLADLYRVVRQALQVGEESYSLKALERFHFRPRNNAIKEAGGSIAAYEAWLRTNDDSLLDEIESYNHDDCTSTRSLRDWLLSLREEARSQFGVDFDELATAAPEEARQDPDWLPAALGLMARLQAGLPDDPELDDADQAERRLLADLLLYHRRETNPQWWRFFELCKTGVAELVDDLDAIGALELDTSAPVVQIKRSLGYWMRFPPQEHRLDLGLVVDPATGNDAGEIVELEADRLLLKRGATFDDVPLPVALIAPRPLQTTNQREAIFSLARAVLDGEDVYAAVRSIIRRDFPRLRGVTQGSSLQQADISVDDVIDRSLRLDSSHLVVQGPPGSGKTYCGGRLIAAALARGDRVAVSATSHKAIHNLLDEVQSVCTADGVSLRGLHKCSDDASRFESSDISCSTSNEAATDPELNLISGTPWLFSRPDQLEGYDLLVVDEAGQMALADVAAIGQCARNVVLLGDPQQLPQVVQGAHPRGSDRSALQHLLAGSPTIDRRRGLFLTQSRRMHPSICAYISETSYAGELSATPECDERGIESPAGAFAGAGLRWLVVSHQGRSQHAPEESSAIAAACQEMLRGETFVRAPGGQRRRLVASDIMVVAPYNLAVRSISGAVPDGVRVGTVDKFQGQEAPVVFFAMTCSTAEDAPRGIGFLFSRHRRNVAISRAQCLAFLVATPQLLDADCKTLEQMQLVNGVCRFAELATEVLVHGLESSRAS